MISKNKTLPNQMQMCISYQQTLNMKCKSHVRKKYEHNEQCVCVFVMAITQIQTFGLANIHNHTHLHTTATLPTLTRTMQHRGQCCELQ